MDVSVIISTYNRPQYLLRVIAGYLHQTRTPREIIIADDGSGEETAREVQRVALKASVPLIHTWHHDAGFRAASIRNKAAARSSGEYLIFTDDDCIPYRFFVEDHCIHVEDGYFIQGHRVLLGEEVSRDFTYRDVKLDRLACHAIKGKVKNAKNAIRLPFPLIRKNESLRGIRSCNLSLFRKDMLSVNGFNEDFVGWGKEDSELVIRLYKRGIRRKDLRFRACCFHLYHPYYGRENVEKNIKLLRNSQNSDDYYCKNGIDKYLEE